MPVLNIDAVDHTNDTLTITAHGLATGAGPAAVRAVGGELPGNVSAVTDYWAIVVDANTIKLADSLANALANTPRNISSNGSGTLVLELGIPYRRARTYQALSQLKSADLNAIQDTLAALHALITGQTQSLWTGIARGEKIRKVSATAGVALSGAFDDTGRWISSAGDQELLIPVTVEEGEHITEITVSAVGDATQTLDVTLFRAATSGAAGSSHSETVTSATGFFGLNLVINEASPGVPLDVEATADGVTYYVYCKSTGAPSSFGVMVGGIAVKTTVPAT